MKIYGGQLIIFLENFIYKSEKNIHYAENLKKKGSLDLHLLYYIYTLPSNIVRSCSSLS
jgi:hypothetical protein